MLGKAFLPKSLFGRAVLILVLPTLLIQLVMAYVFFGRHWDDVTRRLSAALAGETAFLVQQLEQAPQEKRFDIMEQFEATTHIEVYLDASENFASVKGAADFPEYQYSLSQLLPNKKIIVRKNEEGDLIETRILVPGHMLRFDASVKRLESRTTLIYVWWMMGTSVVFLLIAVLFLRNQIRPITRLAEAAENFGRGVDTPNFRPHGATEVRKAARAFVVMRERITRQVRTRTDMLSGISHDLRTPLTRMKLQLAMMPQDGAIKELQEDVQQMEHMIAEYLDFARGEGKEDAVRLDLRTVVADVVGDYERMGLPVTLTGEGSTLIDLRPSAFRRMLHNLIDNALRYGTRCEASYVIRAHYWELCIDDDGAGIPEAKREEVFKPFARLDASRNSKTGGVGLGLTIARDIAQAHGGNIQLGTSPQGGLRVSLNLPL